MSLFKSKKKVLQEDINFLKRICASLPEKYNFLEVQINDDFIISKEVNKLGETGTFTLTLNAKLEKNYANNNYPSFFIIENIKVFNKSRSEYDDVELHILEGIIAGFRINSRYKDLDMDNIDTTQVKERHFKNEAKDELLEILNDINDNHKSLIDIAGTNKFEIDGKEYFTIKIFGDGNYIAIDEEGKIYGLIHDPFEIELLFKQKSDFFNALDSGEFKFNNYYKQKMR